MQGQELMRRLSRLEDKTTRLHRKEVFREGLTTAGMTIVAAAIASIFASIIPSWFESERSKRLETALTQADGRLAQIDNRLREYDNNANDFADQLKSMIKNAGNAVGEAEAKLATLGGISAIQQKLKELKVEVLRTDGVLNGAQNAATKAKTVEQEIQKTAIAMNALELESNAILKRAASIDMIIENATNGAIECREAAREVAAQTNVEFERAMETFTDSLEISFQDWQALDLGKIRRADDAGFAIALINKSDSAKKTRGGVCGFTGDQSTFNKKLDFRTAAYIDTRSNEPTSSLIMPVRKGDFWLVSHCSSLSPTDRPVVDIYWLAIDLVVGR